MNTTIFIRKDIHLFHIVLSDHPAIKSPKEYIWLLFIYGNVLIMQHISSATQNFGEAFYAQIIVWKLCQ